MSSITNISSNISRFGDIVLAALVVAIVGLLIIPLPTPVVDLLIAINIGISTVMLMLSLYLPRALAFSTFPSMLLFTTLRHLPYYHDRAVRRHRERFGACLRSRRAIHIGRHAR